MRRLLPLTVIAALVPLGGSSASACAPPDEGTPPPCCQRTLYTLTVGDTTIHVPDPTSIRFYCS
jgi:hypothetical protein